MELDFAILADGVSHRPGGKIDLFGGGLDTIRAGAAPVRHPLLSLVVRVSLSSDELKQSHELVVLLLGADGAEVARAQQGIEPMADEQRQRIPADQMVGVGVTVAFSDLVFPSFGSYRFELAWDGAQLRSPLRLFVQEQPKGRS